MNQKDDWVLRLLDFDVAAALVTNGRGDDAPELPDDGALRQGRDLWASTREKIGSEIRQLKVQAGAALAGDPDEVEALDALDELDEILEDLNADLIDTLDELLAGGDAREALLAQAREQVGEYKSYAASNAMLPGLEGDTGFGVKLTIFSTVTKTLATLQTTLQRG